MPELILGTKFVGDVDPSVVKSIEQMRKGLSNLLTQVNKFIAQQVETQTSALKSATSVDDLAKSLKAAGGPTKELGKFLSQMSGVMRSYTQNLTSAATALGKTNPKIKESSKGLKVQQASAEAAATAWTKYATKLGIAGNSLSKFQKMQEHLGGSKGTPRNYAQYLLASVREEVKAYGDLLDGFRKAIQGNVLQRGTKTPSGPVLERMIDPWKGALEAALKNAAVLETKVAGLGDAWLKSIKPEKWAEYVKKYSTGVELFTKDGLEKQEAAQKRFISSLDKSNKPLVAWQQRFKNIRTELKGLSKEYPEFAQKYKKATQSALAASLGAGKNQSMVLDRLLMQYQRAAQLIQKQAATKFDKVFGVSDAKTAAKAYDQYLKVMDPMIVAQRLLKGELVETANGFQVLSKNADPKKMNGFAASIQRLGRTMKSLATYALGSELVFGFITAIRTGISEIIDFDQALKNIQAISNSSEEAVKALGETIKGVARTTKFSTTEVADGVVLLSQAGFTLEESQNAIQAASDLATGTLSNFESVTDLLTTTIRAYNMDASQTAEISDIMATAINRSKLNVDKLRTAFGYIAAVASQSGISLKQTAAALGVLANNGLRASTMATGLRQTLNALAKPNKFLKAAIKETGLAISDFDVQTQGFNKVLENMSTLIWDAERGAVNAGNAMKYFSVRGGNAANALVKAFNTGEWQKMLDFMEASEDAARRMAETQLGGLGIAFKNAADRAKLVAIALGDAGLTRALKIVAKAMQVFFTLIETLTKTTLGGFIVKIALIAPLLFGIGKALRFVIPLIISFKAVTETWSIAAAIATARVTVLTKVLNILRVALIRHPIGLLAVALAAGAAAFLSFTKSAEAATAAIAEQQSRLANAKIELQGYADELDFIAKKAKDDAAARTEYINKLSEMLQKFPQLAKQIKLNANAHEQNAAAIRREIERIDELKFNEQIKQYKNQIGQLKKLQTELKITEVSAGSLLDKFHELLFGTSTGKNRIDSINEQEKKLNETIEAITADIAKGFLVSEKFANKTVEDQAKIAEAVLRSKGLAEEYIEAVKQAILQTQELPQKSINAFAKSFGGLLAESRKFSEERLAQLEKDFEAEQYLIEQNAVTSREEDEKTNYKRLESLSRYLIAKNEMITRGLEQAQSGTEKEKKLYEELADAQEKNIEELKDARLSALDAYESALNRLHDLEKEGLEITDQLNDAYTEISRQGLSEVELHQLQVADLYKLLSEQTEIFSDTSQEGYANAKEYVGELISAIKDVAGQVRVGTGDSERFYQTFAEGKNKYLPVMKEIMTAWEEYQSNVELAAKKQADTFAKLTNQLTAYIGDIEQPIELQLDEAAYNQVEDSLEKISKKREVWLKIKVDDSEWKAFQTSSGAPGYKSGGKVGFDTGGVVPGTGTGDKVPAMLEPGEFVITRDAAKKIGYAFLQYLNKGLTKFKKGGLAVAGYAQKLQSGGVVGKGAFTGLNGLHGILDGLTSGSVKPSIASLGAQIGSAIKSSTQGPVSNQMITLDLRVNNESHSLMGSENEISKLVRSLKRSNLVAG
jgi:TP901 family phage tail tape measure protein